MHEQAQKPAANLTTATRTGTTSARPRSWPQPRPGRPFARVASRRGHDWLLGAAVVATFALVAVELIAGYAGHSIALVSDAVHNLTDVPTLVLSWLATRWACGRRRRKDLRLSSRRNSGGVRQRHAADAGFALADLRIGAAAAQSRGGATGLMLWVSVFALVINGGITLALHGGRRDLNVRTVWIHNLGDALSNVAIVVGALAIRYTGTPGSTR